MHIGEAAVKNVMLQRQPSSRMEMHMLATAQNRKWKILSHAVSNDDGRNIVITVGKGKANMHNRPTGSGYELHAIHMAIEIKCHMHVAYVNPLTTYPSKSLGKQFPHQLGLTSRNSGECCSTPNHRTLPFTYSLKRHCQSFYMFISFIQSVPGSTGFAETLPDLSESPVVSPGGGGLV